MWLKLLLDLAYAWLIRMCVAQNRRQEKDPCSALCGCFREMAVSWRQKLNCISMISFSGNGAKPLPIFFQCQKLRNFCNLPPVGGGPPKAQLAKQVWGPWICFRIDPCSPPSWIRGPPSQGSKTSQNSTRTGIRVVQNTTRIHGYPTRTEKSPIFPIKCICHVKAHLLVKSAWIPS